MHAFLSSLAAAAHGGRQPRHVAMAVVLGFMAGAVCDWNLTFASLLLLACWLNCRLWMLPVAGACGFTFASIGAPLTHAVGVFCLDKLELGAIIAGPGSGPFLALFALDDFRTFGALLTSLLVALPAAHAVVRVANHRASESDAPTGIAADPLLRSFGFPAVCCGAVLTATLIHTVGERRAADTFLQRASLALDVQLTADTVDYGLWTGRLEISNLRVAKKDEPETTALLIEQVSAQADPAMFLRGRLACSELTLAGLFCDASSRPQTRPGVFAAGPTLLKEDVPQTSHNEEPSRGVDLRDLVRSWDAGGERHAVLQQLVAVVERLGDLESPAGGVLQKFTERGFAPRKSSLAQPSPLVQVKRLRIERLPAAWRLSPDTRLELTHLSSSPAHAEHFAQLSCRDAAYKLNLAMTFHLAGADRRHAVEVSLEDLAADEVLNVAAVRSSLELGTARFASITGRGTAARDGLELNLCAAVKNVAVPATAGPMAGLDAALWRQSLAYLGEYRVDVKAAGRWNQVKVQCVPAAAVEQLKHQLRAAGAHELVKAVEAQRSFAPGSIAARSAAPAAASYPTTQTPAAAWPLAPAAMPKPAAPTASVATAAPTASQPAVAATPVTQAVAATSPYATPAAPYNGPLTVKPATMKDAADATPKLAAAASVPAPSTTATTSSHVPVVAANAPAALATSPAVTKEALAANDAATNASPSTAVAAAAPAASKQTPASATATLIAPEPKTAAKPTRSARPAIGVASDADLGDAGLAKSDVARKSPQAYDPAPSTVGDRYATARPTLDAATKSAGEKSGVAPSTSSKAVQAVALRQPLSVLDPSAAPGPVNLSVGYTEERSLTPPASELPSKQATPYAVAPSAAGERREPVDRRNAAAGPRLTSPQPLAQQPAAERSAVRELPRQAVETLADAPTAVAEPRAKLFAEESPSPRTLEGTSLARIPDNVEASPPARAAESSGGHTFHSLPERHGNSATLPSQRRAADGTVVKSKGLLGNFSLFGGKPKEVPPGESIELTPPPQSEMQVEQAPKAPSGPKKMFNKVKSFFSFGGEPPLELPEPTDGPASIDERDAPPTMSQRDEVVRPSSYADDPAVSGESVRRAAPEPTGEAAARMSANESFYGRMVR